MSRLGVEAKEAKRILDEAMDEIRKESYDAAKSAAVKLRVAETIKEAAGLALGVGTSLLTAGAATPAVAAGVSAGQIVGQIAGVITNVDAVIKIGVASGKLVTELFTPSTVTTSDSSVLEQSALVTGIDSATKLINFINYSKYLANPSNEEFLNQLVYAINTDIDLNTGAFVIDGSTTAKLNQADLFDSPITSENFGVSDFSSSVLPTNSGDVSGQMPLWVRDQLAALPSSDKMSVFGGTLDINTPSSPGSSQPPSTGSGRFGSCQIDNPNGYNICMEYEGATNLEDLNTACAPLSGKVSSESCQSGVGYCSVTNGGVTNLVYYLGKFSESEARQHCNGSAGSGGTAVFSK